MKGNINVFNKIFKKVKEVKKEDIEGKNIKITEIGKKERLSDEQYEFYKEAKSLPLRELSKKALKSCDYKRR